MPKTRSRPKFPSSTVAFSLLFFLLSFTTPSPVVGGKDTDRSHRRPSIDGRLPAEIGRLLRISHGLAIDRLREHGSCRTLFTQLGTDGAEILSRVRYARDGGRRVSPCRGTSVAAYTDLGSSQVWLCPDGFGGLDHQEATMILLHEALHHAGQPEAPHDPDALTSQELNLLVRRNCDL
jgi:hypothetical protein